jgi:hypothetical protein
MEPSFSHDFSAVRVHADAGAASSAQACAADAYTVGTHIVFGAARYVPASGAGRQLLAHELAHVVQQSGSHSRGPMQRASIGVTPDAEEIGPEDDTLEREAQEAAEAVARGGKARLAASGSQRLQRAPAKPQPAIVGLDEAGPQADLTGRTEDALMACVKGAGQNPPDCAPAAPLTWADFAGAPRRSPFGAETSSDVHDLPMDPVYAGCMQRILAKSKDETRVFQGAFNPKKSWVKPQFANPANATLNGCAAITTKCKRFFDGQAKKGLTGATDSLSTKPDAKCSASAPPAPATATSKSDCQSVLEPACSAAAAVESARLLKHEQGHLNLSCAIARRANNALAAGGKLSAIKTAVTKQHAAAQKAYDNESKHGCNAAQQANWESDIAAGLPKVTIP